MLRQLRQFDEAASPAELVVNKVTRERDKFRDQAEDAAETLHQMSLWLDHEPGRPHNECPHCLYRDWSRRNNRPNGR